MKLTNDEVIKLRSKLSECLKPFIQLFLEIVQHKTRKEIEELALDFASALARMDICRNIIANDFDYESLVQSIFEELVSDIKE